MDNVTRPPEQPLDPQATLVTDRDQVPGQQLGRADRHDLDDVTGQPVGRRGRPGVSIAAVPTSKATVRHRRDIRSCQSGGRATAIARPRGVIRHQGRRHRLATNPKGPQAGPVIRVGETPGKACQA